MRYFKLQSMYGYEDAPVEQKKEICNGCGSGGGWKSWIVPDTIWGLSITDCCNIHDWGYHFGTSEWGKEVADDLMLENMNTKIDAHSWWFRWVRKRRALKYYLAVKHLGEKAYMANKEGVNEVTLTEKDFEHPDIKEFKVAYLGYHSFDGFEDTIGA